MKNTLILTLFLVLYQLSFSQEREDGPYKNYYKSGELYQEGQYLNNKRVGQWRNYYKNGQVSREYSYNKGKLNEEDISYYKDGTISSKTIKVEDGYVRYGYYESGKLKYERKKDTGYYKKFFEVGTIEIEAEYLNNELVGLWKKYYDNGQLEWMVTYKDGYREGVYKHYYKNGDIKLEGNNVNDKVDGEEKRYLRGNILQWQGDYKAGVLNKTWTKFDENGKKLESIKFKKGKANKEEFQSLITPTKVVDGVIERVPVFPGCENLLTNSKRKKCMSRKVSEVVVANFNKDLMSELGLSSGKHRIFLQFKIDKEGRIKDIQVRASRIELQVEAVRVIKLLPQLEPGYQRGKAVIVPFALPIVFQVVDKNKRKN